MKENNLKNTSLLLYLHPVRNRVLGRFSSLDRTSQVDRASVEKKLLRQGCLTSIRVGNNGECTPFFDLLRYIFQKNLPPNLLPFFNFV